MTSRSHLPTVQDGEHLLGQNWQTLADCLVHLRFINQSCNAIHQHYHQKLVKIT